MYLVTAHTSTASAPITVLLYVRCCAVWLCALRVKYSQTCLYIFCRCLYLADGLTMRRRTRKSAFGFVVFYYYGRSLCALCDTQVRAWRGWWAEKWRAIVCSATLSTRLRGCSQLDCVRVLLWTLIDSCVLRCLGVLSLTYCCQCGSFRLHISGMNTSCIS